MADEELPSQSDDDEGSDIKKAKKLVGRVLQFCQVESLDNGNHSIKTHAVDDDGNFVEANCKILTRGVGNFQFVGGYEVGNFVICAFPGEEVSGGSSPIIGYCLGAFFSPFDNFVPCGNDHEIRFFESKIIFKEDGELVIKCTGDVSIDGNTIRLNR